MRTAKLIAKATIEKNGEAFLQRIGINLTSIQKRDH